MADIFDIVADPTRRALLEALRERAVAGDPTATVPELVDATGAARQSVNRHLAILADAGLATVVDDDPERVYALDATPLEALEDWLVPFLTVGPAAAAAAAFSAWSGADVGETIGRAIAERSFQARSVIRDAQETITTLADRLPEPVRKRVRRDK